MDKVKITREQADLLDSILENTDKGWLFEQLSNWHGVTTCTPNMADLHSFYVANPLLASKAMIVGYEVEETPEDKVRELFRKEKEHDANGSTNASWILTGALRVLEIYNIKIEGIN